MGALVRGGLAEARKRGGGDAVVIELCFGGAAALDHRALNRNRNADSNCAGSDLRRKDDRC